MVKKSTTRGKKPKLAPGIFVRLPPEDIERYKRDAVADDRTLSAHLRRLISLGDQSRAKSA